MNHDITLGVIEGRFADIVWEKAPISSSDLVKLAAEKMNWKRTTTHTVIKKLCEKGLFKRDSEGIVSVLITREEFHALQGKQVVNDAYGGSLPMFVAGFVNHQKLSQKEIDEIIRIMNSIKTKYKKMAIYDTARGD